jgi:hypothetical protein
VLSVLSWLLIVLDALDLFGITIIVFLNVLMIIMLIDLILASNVLVILIHVHCHLSPINYTLKWNRMSYMDMWNLIELLIYRLLLFQR